MEETLRRYKDTPLHTEHSIRLLKLQPATDDDSPLQAILERSSLHDKPLYEALSYTWSDAAPSHRIKLSDETIMITENLRAALVRLRRNDNERIFWIDAICINQRDDVEKSKQVAIMGDIFREAKVVLIWLGEPTESRFMAFDFLAQLSQKSEIFRLSRGESLFGEEAPALACEVTEAVELLNEAISAGVGTIFHTKWFTRLWIVQEYTLAKTVQIHFGRLQIDEASFAKAVKILMGLMKKSGGLRQELAIIQNHAWILVRHRDLHHLLSSPGFYVSEPKAFFEKALIDFKYQVCKDDRDRVFGFLAFDPNPSKIVPDYTKTIAEVYTEFSINNLSYLSLFHAGLCWRGPFPDLNQLRLDRNYLPSWVTDRRISSDIWSPIFGNYFAMSSAVRGVMFWTHRPQDVGILTAWGFHFDIVEKIIPRIACNGFSPTTNAESFLEMVDHLQRIRKEAASEMLYVTGELAELALATMLAGGQTALPSDIPEHPLRDFIKNAPQQRNIFEHLWLMYLGLCVSSHGKIYKKVLEFKDQLALPADFTKDFTDQEKEIWIFHIYLAKVIQKHDVILTKDRYFGLAPPETESGDVVAVLSGHRTPFLVRKTPSIERSGDSCCIAPHKRIDGNMVPFYNILGPCYLHGIMANEIYNLQKYAEQFEWELLDKGRGLTVRIPATVLHLI
jgi:Heterokaryon incompatibility protein (HET)